jgi:hypothetical protein
LAKVEERDYLIANNLPKKKKTAIKEKDVIIFIQNKFSSFNG